MDGDDFCRTETIGAQPRNTRHDETTEATVVHLACLDVDGALARLAVLGQLHRQDTVPLLASNLLGQPVDDADGLIEQLAALDRVADLVSPFPIEAESLSASVQPRAHAISVLG